MTVRSDSLARGVSLLAQQPSAGRYSSELRHAGHCEK